MKKAKTITCQQCQSEMQRGTKVEKSIGKQFLGILVFFIGLFVAIVGFVGCSATEGSSDMGGFFMLSLGAVMMVGSLSMGYKKLKGWKCPNCGYFFEAS